MKERNENRKYIVLLSALGVNFLSGMIYMWSIISKSLIEDLNWTSSQASLPYTLYTISFVIAMVIFGRLQDEKGPRPVVTLGAIFMGSGIILSGIFTKPNILIFTMGIIAGAGVGMVTVASSPPVVKWFPPEKKGLVTGIVVAGTGLSSIFYSPLADYLIRSYGVSKALIVIGFIALVPTSIIAQGLSNPPKMENDNESDQEFLGKNYTWQEMLKDSDFYKLWLIFAFGSSAGLMITGHISTIADIQVNWEAGFILVILIAVFNTLGRFSGGILSDKIGRVNLMRITLGLQIINMFLFSRYSSKLALGIGVGIVGFCYGSNFSVFPATVADIYGMKHYGINYGLIFTGWGLGGVIGPMVAAKIFDATGHYDKAYIVAGILLIISMIISFTINKKEE